MSDNYDNSLMSRQFLKDYEIENVLNQDINEFAINKPNEYWIEDINGWHNIKSDKLSLENLERLARVLAIFNEKKLDRDNPIASLTLPNGERCQIVLPPVCEADKISITIRKPSSGRFTLNEYSNSGRLNPKITINSSTIKDWEQELLELIKQQNFVKFFELAVKNHLNIITVGGTGSGKTTFSKCLIDLYPTNKRLFTIEDAHELTTPKHLNSVHLFFSPIISAKEVLASCMRMKPDHIFITELRGDESWDYLMALKSGHAGSVTSIHANDCRGALYKLGSYIKQSEVGQSLDFSYIMQEVKTTIDVVIYFNKTYLTEIYYNPINKLKLLQGLN